MMVSAKSKEIALFPLKGVLFPHARTVVQIYEPRYMDMVKTCLKAELGFGVILLEAGSEVYQPGLWRSPAVVELGCYGKIVDWDALSEGRLGLVLEGTKKFRIRECWETRDRLLRGEVEWLDEESDQPLPQIALELAELLRRLSAHPTVQQLNMPCSLDSALITANQLAQLLPIDAWQKQQLLELDSPVHRLESIEALLGELAG